MKKRIGILLLLSMFALTALYGCSGGNKEDGGSTNSANENNLSEDQNGESSSDMTADADEPVYGGSVIVGITQDLDSLDPHKAVAAGTNEVLYNIFEGLVKPDKDGNLVPAVASDYSISEDGMTYTFTLRDGVQFHNGNLVTADDVIYSIKRSAGMLETSDPEVKVESALSVIADITSMVTEEGKTQIQILLSEPNTELIGYLTTPIIPKDYDGQAETPVGTGPFKFVSYTPLQSIVMEKNEDYYVEGVPYLDQVTFKISANTDSAFMELMAGAIDIFPYLTEEQANQLSSTYDIEVGNMNLVQGLFLNNQAAPFDNMLVRQALCYAIDRQGILDMVAGGKGQIIGSNMFHGFSIYYNDTLEDVYAYNPEKAKELLAEAGYADGFSFTIKVPSNYQFHVDTAQVIVEQLKAVGIDAKIQLIEWASWLSDVYKARDYEATIVGLDAKLAPSDVLKRYRSTASNNFLNYENAEFDTIFAEAIGTIDQDIKIQKYKELQEILTNDAASVYIQDPALLVAVNKKLTGYTFYPVYVQDMSVVAYTGTPENHQ